MRKVRFILPTGYAPRVMRLVLATERKGWRFYGEHDGYLVPARGPYGLLLASGMTFPSRKRAAEIAYVYDLPPYAIWNGRKRCYEGDAAEFLAAPHNGSSSYYSPYSGVSA